MNKYNRAAVLSCFDCLSVPVSMLVPDFGQVYEKEIVIFDSVSIEMINTC